MILHKASRPTVIESISYHRRLITPPIIVSNPPHLSLSTLIVARLTLSRRLAVRIPSSKSTIIATLHGPHSAVIISIASLGSSTAKASASSRRCLAGSSIVAVRIGSRGDDIVSIISSRCCCRRTKVVYCRGLGQLGIRVDTVSPKRRVRLAVAPRLESPTWMHQISDPERGHLAGGLPILNNHNQYRRPKVTKRLVAAGRIRSSRCFRPDTRCSYWPCCLMSGVMGDGHPTSIRML
ncbi:hypothetical protein DB88DRAFT_352297 [Papiliotrema laurentii]|uniref:Uncharacterized protein n=1 Tax=Papiliotrema laurentii TaxID=5418 RepID=A0AAD9CUM9_PAPLA|nr:hypothetical protein DB88DRAFT_352297 [Papiliotrema laurentii]